MGWDYAGGGEIVGTATVGEAQVYAHCHRRWSSTRPQRLCAPFSSSGWSARPPMRCRWCSTCRPAWTQRFEYRAGQFLTLRVEVDGEEHRRCYSMSSSPHAGEEPADHRETGPGRRGVELAERQRQPRRRDPRGATGGPVRTRESDREVVAFAGGSGVTPVFSLIRSALAGSTRKRPGVLRQPRPRTR